MSLENQFGNQQSNDPTKKSGGLEKIKSVGRKFVTGAAIVAAGFATHEAKENRDLKRVQNETIELFNSPTLSTSEKGEFSHFVNNEQIVDAVHDLRQKYPTRFTENYDYTTVLFKAGEIEKDGSRNGYIEIENLKELLNEAELKEAVSIIQAHEDAVGKQIAAEINERNSNQDEMQRLGTSIAKFSGKENADDSTIDKYVSKLTLESIINDENWKKLGIVVEGKFIPDGKHGVSIM